MGDSIHQRSDEQILIVKKYDLENNGIDKREGMPKKQRR